MSLQQSPLLRGMQAGKAAYSTANLPISIESSLDEARQQRQMLGLNAKGSYPVSGTSAAAYQYLHGQGGYPYTQSNQGPTTISYEQAHGITGPQSQASLAQQAKDAPWRGTSGSTTPTVNTKPSAGATAISYALPAALAYKYLATPGMKEWMAKNTGLDILGPSAKEAATLGKTAGTSGVTPAATREAVPGYTEPAYTGDYTAPAGEGVSAASPYQMTSADAQAIYGDRGYGVTGATPATQAGTYDLGEFAGVDQAAAEQAAKNYMGDAYGVDAATAWNAAPALNTTAGEIGYVYNPLTGALEGGTAEQLAAASIPTAAEGVSAIEAANAAQAANELALAADATAGAEGASLMAIDPYTAGLAALLAMTPGGQNILNKLTGAVTGIAGGVGDLLTSGVNTVTNAVSDVAGGIGDVVGGAVESIGDFFGFAEGGNVNGISAALPQNFNLGGYSDGGRLLKGPGDGVSDSIPATIGHQKQPARLADGEFVVPARIVSELGNGSTDAGARKLYAMMDRIQADRKKSVGKGKVAVNSRADKHLPA